MSHWEWFLFASAPWTAGVVAAERFRRFGLALVGVVTGSALYALWGYRMFSEPDSLHWTTFASVVGASALCMALLFMGVSLVHGLWKNYVSGLMLSDIRRGSTLVPPPRVKDLAPEQVATWEAAHPCRFPFLPN